MKWGNFALMHQAPMFVKRIKMHKWVQQGLWFLYNFIPLTAILCMCVLVYVCFNTLLLSTKWNKYLIEFMQSCIQPSQYWCAHHYSVPLNVDVDVPPLKFNAMLPWPTFYDMFYNIMKCLLWGSILGYIVEISYLLL